MTRTVLALAIAVLALTGSAAQQAAQFRVGADLVSIYATAIDADRRLVTDLTRDDFEVYDDGKLQPIALFSSDLQPVSIVVMLDRSGSMEPHFNLIRDGAIEFVRRMLPDDRARIGSFANEIRIGPADFTGDQDALINVLRHELQQVGPSPVWAAIDRSITAVQTQQGRRVVLTFTDGHDDAARGQPITHLKDLQRRMRLNEIMIYAIGFAGEGWQQVSSGGWSSTSGAGARSGVAFSKSAKPPDPALKELADDSGGGYFEMRAGDDLIATFARVSEELHRQYWLGFTPPRLDGKNHEIEVRVKRPGVKVRARRSYEAKGGSAGDGHQPPSPR